MQAEDFPNINAMTKVDSYFVTNLLGYEKEAIAVATSPTGGECPVGTLIQLVPQEAMVKRRALPIGDDVIAAIQAADPRPR